jgi:hypothetical protein
LNAVINLGHRGVDWDIDESSTPSGKSGKVVDDGRSVEVVLDDRVGQAMAPCAALNSIDNGDVVGFHNQVIDKTRWVSNRVVLD